METKAKAKTKINTNTNTKAKAKAMINVMALITIKDSEYPFLLKQIANPPQQISLYGNYINLNQKMVTIIGTNNPTKRGKREAASLVKQFIKEGYCIVTAITQGINEVVYKTAMENNGKVLVVIPIDLECDKIGENEKYIEIMENGNGAKKIKKWWCTETIKRGQYAGKVDYILENNGNILAECGELNRELKDNYDTVKYKFQNNTTEKYLRMNQILTGLSSTLIVVEAGKTSGTMFAVENALAQNREIYSVIGNLKSMKKVGTNFLVKQGAKPIISKVLEI